MNVRADDPLQLATERLVLEPIRPEHAAEMVEVLADPDLYGFTGGEPPTVRELRRRYEIQAVGRSPDGLQRWRNWIVRRRVEGDAIGFVQATIDDADGSADVAWVIGVPWQGRGYAVEAARAMLSHLAGLGLLVTAHVHPDHAASEAVARRLGLEATDAFEDGERVWRRAPAALGSGPA